MKNCTKCQMLKELSEFAKQPNKKDGSQSRCKTCQAGTTRAWYANNREYCRQKRYERYKKNQKTDRERVKKFLKDNPQKTKQYMLRSKWGISMDQFQLMLKEQSNACPMCEQLFSGDLPACVDHNHTTGKIRGLLCSPCNRAFGLLKESKATATNLIKYIEKYN